MPIAADQTSAFDAVLLDAPWDLVTKSATVHRARPEDVNRAGAVRARLVRHALQRMRRIGQALDMTREQALDMTREQALDMTREQALDMTREHALDMNREQALDA